MKRFFICFFILSFQFAHSQCSFPDSCSISASIPYNGDTAHGDYSIFYADAGHVLDNPVIIVEGLDFNNNVGCTYFNNVSGIPSVLNSYGYDVVFLNLHTNLDYIQRNAFLIVELINKINQYKIGNNKLIAAGMNSGAVELRYALSYMEAHNIDHQTKCFLSIDGAQRGFNIPLTLQVWIAQIAADGINFGNVDAIATDILLQAPIFSQLLYCDHDRSIAKDYPAPSLAYDSFFSELRSLNSCYGYPTKCKKIAISNGSISGESQLRYDGFSHAYSTDLFFGYDNITSSPLNTFSGIVHATADTSVRPIIMGGHNIVEVGVSDYFSYFLWGLDSVDYFRPYDVCPGSYSEFVSSAAYNISAYAQHDTIGFVNATFVPTVSAFDINTEDFYFNFAAHSPIDGTISPFDKTYSFNGLNNNANYFDFYGLMSNTDILSEILSADAYAFCDQQDYTIGSTEINADSSETWNVSRYLYASDLVVKDSALVTLKAGSAIVISPGFELKHGSVGTITIEQCNYNLCAPPAFKTNEKSASYRNDEQNITSHPMSLEIYPNPANTILNVKLPQFTDEKSEIFIYDYEGALIKRLLIHQQQLQIDVADLPSGIYLLTFKSNKSYESKKFSVIHL